MLTPGQDADFHCFGSSVSRVGKVHAALATAELISEFRPKCLINAGTAGGIKSAGMHVGDIVVASHVCAHDMHIPIDGYRQYGQRRISLPDYKKLSFLKSEYKVGVVSSGDSFSTSLTEWDVLRNSNAIAKEMEAFGVASTVEMMGYTNPVYVIKSITDVISPDSNEITSSEDFSKNFTLAMHKLSDFVAEIVSQKELIV